jgi:hypothetical protein
MGGLTLILVIALLSLVLALQPQLFFPDYAITGTLTGPMDLERTHQH